MEAAIRIVGADSISWKLILELAAVVPAMRKPFEMAIGGRMYVFLVGVGRVKYARGGAANGVCTMFEPPLRLKSIVSSGRKSSSLIFRAAPSLQSEDT